MVHATVLRSSLVGKTAQEYDALERQTKLRRFKDGTTSIDHVLSYATAGGGLAHRPTSIKDGKNQETTYVLDDAGRTVEEVSPDRGTTRWEHHVTNNVLSQTREGVGSAVEETTTVTFDALGRLTVKEVGGATCSRTPPVVGPDVSLFYDAVPAGETCPVAGGCTNVKDRLVLAKFEQSCQAGLEFGKFWHAYDKVGRTTAEHREAAGRTDVVKYAWDKNGNRTQITYPSTATVDTTYGSAGDIVFGHSSGLSVAGCALAGPAAGKCVLALELVETVELGLSFLSCYYLMDCVSSP